MCVPQSYTNSNPASNSNSSCTSTSAAAPPQLVMEEAPESYKNVTDVVNTCHAAGISRKVNCNCNCKHCVSRPSPPPTQQGLPPFLASRPPLARPRATDGRGSTDAVHALAHEPLTRSVQLPPGGQVVLY